MKNKTKNKARKNDGRKSGKPQGFAEVREESKRLNRVLGQVEGIQRMMEDGRGLDAVLVQFKAVHSALKSIELRLLKRHLEAALEDALAAEKRKDREEKIEALLELFKPAG